MDNLFSKYRASCLLSVMILSVFFFFCQTTGAMAGAEKALDGLDKAAGQAYSGANTPGTDVISDVPTTVGKIVGYILSFVGILFLILMIYAGFLWMLARGNDQQVSKAKDLIGAAIIGLIIVLAAYAITAFLGDILTN